MTAHDRFVINSSKVVHDNIDGEVIIINFETGNYYSLNAVGRDIWNSLESCPALIEIINQITGKYEVNSGIVKEDIILLLTDLQKEELIMIKIDESSLSLIEDTKNHLTENIENNVKLKYNKPGFLKYTDMKEMLLLDPIHDVDETGWPSAKIVNKKKDQ